MINHTLLSGFVIRECESIRKNLIHDGMAKPIRCLKSRNRYGKTKSVVRAAAKPGMYSVWSRTDPLEGFPRHNPKSIPKGGGSLRCEENCMPPSFITVHGDFTFEIISIQFHKSFIKGFLWCTKSQPDFLRRFNSAERSSVFRESDIMSDRRNAA